MAKRLVGRGSGYQTHTQARPAVRVVCRSRPAPPRRIERSHRLGIRVTFPLPLAQIFLPPETYGLVCRLLPRGRLLGQKAHRLSL